MYNVQKINDTAFVKFTFVKYYNKARFLVVIF